MNDELEMIRFELFEAEKRLRKYIDIADPDVKQSLRIQYRKIVSAVNQIDKVLDKTA